ncbi:MBG domain-containing protein [Luteolibacter flavescens]|uniref:MBG domain-containing protein n=1 Tax=Luteolibacter flavescens TaxID=1859460 RepID=A0ABT3FVT2_9BACT|nr:MBG domain-containing protein [Luteolibacter flavescens]MCW1887329.1 MBG domain-containing protein [Luteolibacter flavescens]
MNLPSFLMLALMWAGCNSLLAAAEPADISFSDLTQTYDGAPKLPTVLTQPPGLPVQWHITAPGGALPGTVSSTVYSNIPAKLASSYTSISFATQQTQGFGDYVNLGGTARKLQSVDAVLVTWAKAASHPQFAARNPEGWEHPVKVVIYSMNSNGALSYVAEKTQTVFVPWRPMTNPDGSAYLSNGYAFRVSIPFPSGITLPNRAMVMISYNTEKSGFEPIGTPGPYNELNVATAGLPATVGSNVESRTVLWVRTGSWSYPTTQTADPLIQIVASETVQSNPTPPVNAGKYQVTATVAGSEGTGSATTLFQIAPATAQVEIGNLKQVADGSPKAVSVTSSPEGLPLEILYAGSATPPSAMGSYDVSVSVTDPNYTGIASGTLQLGTSISSWLQPLLDSGAIPAGETGDEADPDADGIDNLLEYAFGLHPGESQSGAEDRRQPYVELDGTSMALVYHRSIHAVDLQIIVESSTDGRTWTQSPTEDTVLSTDGDVETVQAKLPDQPEASIRFARLKVERLND